MPPLVDAFVMASEKDPYKEARGKGREHRDGWGYVLFKDGNVRHYRSLRPVFEDIDAVESLKSELEGFVVLMAHSRAASQGSKNLFNTQPFGFSTRRGFSYWIYHNGDLDKGKIIEMAEFEEKDLESASDSYAMAAYLCRRLESFEASELLKHYSALAKTAKTSFNTGTLFLGSDGTAAGFVTAYSKPLYIMNPKNWDYVRQNVLREDGLFAVGSSTLELYFKAEWKPVVNGTAFYVDIDFENEAFNVKELVLG
ncbi:class II glutamine amidotransferase [Thermococcus pacificus]|nr:class II glutamine amidotransferase [Thermococcus pacificus]